MRGKLFRPRCARLPGPKIHTCTPHTGANLHKCPPSYPTFQFVKGKRQRAIRLIFAWKVPIVPQRRSRVAAAAPQPLLQRALPSKPSSASAKMWKGQSSSTCGFVWKVRCAMRCVCVRVCLFMCFAEPALFNLLEPSEEWDGFQGEIFSKAVQYQLFNVNAGELAYALWHQLPEIQPFITDFRSRYLKMLAPGGRSEDLWRTICEYMRNNNHSAQLHFEVTVMASVCTVSGNIFKGGLPIAATLQFTKGVRVRVCVCVCVSPVFRRRSVYESA
jgi:hypothetical protein